MLASNNSNSSKIRVKFVTEFDQFRITDAPFAVPSNLGRFGLSEVVNHLLDLDEPQPFDFMIVDRLLRAPLSKFVLYNRLSTEDAIVIEYFPAKSLADESNTVETPAWVGSLSCDVTNTVVAGCYNGSVDIFDSAKLQKKTSIAAHQQPIRAISCWDNTTNNNSDNHNTSFFVATASKDQSIKCWGVNEKGESLQKSVLLGHCNSVESLTLVSAGSAGVAASAGGGLLVSGDWNGALCGWRLSDVMGTTPTAAGGEDGEAEEEVAGSKKKRKTGHKADNSVDASSSSAPRTLKPAFTIKAHAQSIAGVCSSSNTNSLYTCSWDHSVKQWDLERQDCISTFAGSKVTTSIDCNRTDGTVITSHTDGKIRLWDPRQKGASGREVQNVVGVRSTYGSSKSADWVSQVRWKPNDTSSVNFAAIDYAGAVSLWDMRSSVPLSCSELHGGKGLCVAWAMSGDDATEDTDISSCGQNSEAKVISGGADCCIKATSIM